MDIIIDVKPRLHAPEVMRLVQQYQYKPTDVKTAALVAAYQGNARVAAYGYMLGDTVSGLIVLRVDDNEETEIIGLAVDPALRNRRIGKRLVQYAADRHGQKKLYCETDDDTVEFYACCGFAIQDLGYVYENIRRYRCTFEG